LRKSRQGTGRLVFARRAALTPIPLPICGRGAKEKWTARPGHVLRSPDVAGGHGPGRHSAPRPGTVGAILAIARHTVRHFRPPRRPLSGLQNDVRRHHPKTDVPVTVVRIVPVPGGAAHIPRIIVVGAPTQHTRQRSGPARKQPRLRLSRQAAVCRSVRCQPPSSRPISVTIPAACSYWPGLSHSHFAASRR
jgi:hypothetical protein